MKRAGLTQLVLVAVIAAGATGCVACADSEFTECFALLSSESDAEAVADELRDAAPGLGIELEQSVAPVTWRRRSAPRRAVKPRAR